ncbi:hypothetical protein NXY11_22005 [Parabacteroides faecis]|uniref:hypothetical protein n=1 Tax=Parabacteroides faecis TaxID=1217282 RepID=UPI002164051B|nr:hypothetical protein [Parabacteroides faecis]MCS2890522.1 hypothetical protein [Parabacteroides faecis]UVQ45805.1 hypothetical protein NXY11_22005 [Parabacteroides faecis]
MSVKETGVSYYGISYPEHAKKDFQEMIEHNCNAVILALSEFDIDFWFPNIIEITKVAKGMGLKVYLDTWGIGKWFGGEPASNFLTNNPKNRQVSAFSNELLPAACFNTKAFRDYFYGICEKLATEVDADGFFWDEPHYALPKSYASITGGPGDDWSCRCPVCQKKFEEEYGYEMPKIMTKEVIEFRENSALEILKHASELIKSIRPNSRITCCVHATINTYYVKENRGYDNWDKVCKVDVFDVFSTTIINYSLPRSYFKSITQRTINAAKQHGKSSQRWLMGYYNEPEKMEEIKDIVHLYDDMGVESLFAWTYRGGYGTVLAAPHALEMWDMLGEAYGEVLDKEYSLKK